MQRAELYRLRGMFLAAIGGDEAQIEASFCAAINTAKEQKSMSLEKRAKATYAEYRRQKGSASGGRGSGYLFGMVDAPMPQQTSRTAMPEMSGR
jgi:hypothetical protein